ncbi:MAG TPA: LamG domain-containing protein, partial [Polyangiaceae bacterium]
MFLTPAAGSPSTLRFALKVPGINGGAEAQISYPFTFPLGVWTHVAVVLEGNLGTLYVDGVPVATNPSIVANPSDMGPTFNNWLGESQYGADPTLDGSLDEFEVSCRAYSPVEIADRASAGGPVCGNASCQAGEDCASCPADCGACPPVCGDATCDPGEDCSSCPADCGECGGPFIDADFSAGADGFVYADDAFRGTSQPDYASGSVTSGALQVNLGGVNETDVVNMSGGFSRSFTLSAPTAVTFNFGYTLSMTADYEPDECSEVLVSIDGTLYGSGADDFVARRCDVAGESGMFVRTTPVLPAGTHTITLGGFNTQKTTASEQTTIRIDDVLLVEAGSVPLQLFFDDFSGGLSQWVETGEGDWNTEGLHSMSGYPGLGSGSPAAHSDNCDSTCTITLSTPINLSGYTAASLAFLRFVDSELDAGEFLRVEVFNGTAWSVLFNWQQGAGGGDDNTWHAETVDLAPYLGLTGFNLRFVTSSSATTEHVHVDDVIIVAQ